MKVDRKGVRRLQQKELSEGRSQALQKELGAEYQLEEALTQRHRTPAGGEQQFLYCRFRRATS